MRFRMASSERKAVVGNKTRRGNTSFIHAGGSGCGPGSIQMDLLPSFRTFPGTGCAATHDFDGVDSRLHGIQADLYANKRT